MFTLQTDLEKVCGTFRMEEKYVEHSTAQLDAINQAFKQQGEADKRAWKWVASLSALVRPLITYLIFGLYCAFKITMIVYAIQSGQIKNFIKPNTHQTFLDSSTRIIY